MPVSNQEANLSLPCELASEPLPQDSLQEWEQSPRRTKKSPQKPAKPLNSLEDLAHTVDERFVVAYP
ncbi:hypothetical protein DSO57_1027475, partial [Entomophthora muscae]